MFAEKLSALLHTIQLLWIVETSGVPCGISVPFEGQETWTQRYMAKLYIGSYQEPRPHKELGVLPRVIDPDPGVL